MKDRGLKGLDKKLSITAWGYVIVPIVFGQLFHLAQLLERKQSDVLCTLNSNDYLVFLAMEAGRSNITSYIPFAAWQMLSVITMQLVASIILLYEFHVIIVNRKDKKKESLFKNHKKSMLGFFTVLALLFAVSDWYISIKKPEAIEHTKFIYSLIEQRQDFFMVCGNASTVKLGDESEIIGKD